jgi:predicted transcriptional regulator
MRTVTAQLPDPIAEGLDALAAAKGHSTASLIRQAVADLLAKHQDLERLTIEGLEAARAGDLVEHAEVVDELEQWGS